MRKLFLILYYSLLRWLPNNNSLGILGRVSGLARECVCRHIFRSMGENNVIARGAYFGTGSGICLGNFSTLGPRCHIQATDIVMGDYVMMAPYVLIPGGGHCTDGLSTPMIRQGVLPRCKLTIGNEVMDRTTCHYPWPNRHRGNNSRRSCRYKTGTRLRCCSC